MPWHFRGAVGDSPIVCTGPGCKAGWIPCPVDHNAQPFNEEWQGEQFFRCEECDFLIPDEFGENGENAGMTMCPECQAGERNDTYDGPCDFCHKTSRPAERRTFPEELHPMIEAQRSWYHATVHACEQCFAGKTLELRTEHAGELERRAYTRLHEEAGDPVGTCDNCGRPDYLAVTGPDLYVCFRCVEQAAAVVPKQRRAAKEPAVELAAPAYTVADAEDPDDYDPDDTPPAGFYDDPEEAGYLRWWSGYEWVGGPVHSDHIADSVTT